ncbi:MAG: DMT family transporter [Methanobacteriota archaeon]|nr:MAG: DMT family transporter [Euryarchaeota archaeon]
MFGRSARVRRGPQAAILTAIVCVSFASVFIRWSASPALTIALYRMGFATVLLSPFLTTAKGAQLRTLTVRDYGLLAVVGFALAAHFATWILSLRLVDVATSVVIVTSHPLLVAVVSHFAFRERVSRSAILGIGVGFGGVLVIALAQAGRGSNPLLGSFLAFLGAIGAGAYLLAGRRLRPRMDLAPYAVNVYGFATLFLVLFSVVAATPVVITTDFAREMVLFLLLAVVSQIGGHTLYNYALRHVSATVVSTSLLGEPVGASILAFLLLGEVPGCSGGACPSSTTFLIIAGSALALAGIYLTARSSGGTQTDVP